MAFAKLMQKLSLTRQSAKIVVLLKNLNGNCIDNIRSI